MIHKNELKYIQSFAHKKHWAEESVFIIEGPKMMEELMASEWVIRQAYATKEWIESQPFKPHYVTEVADFELDKLTQLHKANQVIALVEKKQIKGPIQLKGKMTLCLDGIQDPGNLGTIIRLSDWFGVNEIVCSNNTVDCYNAKVVQASMGSLTRVNITYTDLELYLKNTEKPKFASLMNGKNVYKTKLPKDAILVMGNEANGISESVLKLMDNSVSIPRFGNLKQTESLNVATATAILLSEFKRLT